MEVDAVDADTSVLVVGGSLVGLSTALFLAHRGVPCLVVERHAGTSIQYKFRGISPRSMELYRAVGIEAEIRARDVIDDRSAYVARMTHLGDSQISWQGIPWAETRDISPATAATCDQDQLEPILLAAARRCGADVRFDTELVAFDETAAGVSARVRDRSTGAEYTVRAGFLVGADGPRSPVRQSLGIDRHGPGVLQHWMNVIFEADLPTSIDGRTVRSIFVTDINGTFVPRGDGRWLMAVQYDPARGESPDGFTPDACTDLIRRGAGRADLAVRVIDARPWEAAAAVADRFGTARVFLAGDSAHVMPPTGGFGGNTGIHDAYNLAWKLDAVSKGRAAAGLLDTYDAERRPVADATMDQALARLQAWFKDPGQRLPPAVPIADDGFVVFGYRYPRGAFVPDRDDDADVMFEDPRSPTAQPGSRAPYLLVRRGADVVSTIDLFAGKWVLFSGPEGQAWPEIVRRTAGAAAFGVVCWGLQPAGDLEDVDGRWPDTARLDGDGAVLIRPDGFVAWHRRTAQGDAHADLDAAFTRLWARHDRASSGRHR